MGVSYNLDQMIVFLETSLKTHEKNSTKKALTQKKLSCMH
jgi:hypothetical protein